MTATFSLNIIFLLETMLKVEEVCQSILTILNCVLGHRAELKNNDAIR